MKKLTLSLVSIMAMSGLAYAGGDIAPVEEPVVVPVAVDNSAFYVGLGFGRTILHDDQSAEEFTSSQVMLQAGYQYNQYIALEGRASFGFNTDYDPGNTGNPSSDAADDISYWGIYVKPMYPVTEKFDIYALLGYGGVQLGNLESGDAYESGFQWGLGAQYEVMENVLIFADYVSLYDDTGFDYRAQFEDVDSNAWTLGVSYRF
ncbi:outer membrane protein [Sulfurovum lithotrophicum]|uniref:outer membrane protein n=1 Tax=Sulfurovum lithotrophicum TaxID=206403 RepID=UPI000697C58B|nr:porin family protein [Sulfurovum lithotrophicum]